MRLLFVFGFLLLMAAKLGRTADFADLEEIRANLNQLGALRGALDNIREWERDGLARRIDQLGIAAVSGLNEVAPELLAMVDTGTEQRAEVIELLDEAAALALERSRDLESRAARERQSVPKFTQSAEADIARAFIEGLTLTREQYLTELVEQAKLRREAGLEYSSILENTRQQVALMVETLTGQIRLDSSSLRELRSRLSGQPLDENLNRAITLVQAKQYRTLDNLERLLEAADRLGLATAEQRGLLLRERGQVGLELLRRDVFAQLWNEQLRGLRDGAARLGPNILFRTLLFVVVVFLGWLAARLIRIPVRAMLYRESVTLSVLLRDVLVSLFGALVLVAGFILALAVVGVSLGPLLAGIGVLGIILGLAVQDSLSNLAAGAMILIYRPYDMDDHINVNGAEGLVKRMNLLATTLSTLDNQSVVIPNGRIWGDTIINYTAHRVRRVDIKVTVAYREDVDRVIAVLAGLLEKLEYVLEKPEPLVHVSGMEDSAVALMVKPWVKTVDYWPAVRDLNRQIKKTLDAEGIEIPFPQRVVRLLSHDGVKENVPGPA